MEMSSMEVDSLRIFFLFFINVSLSLSVYIDWIVISWYGHIYVYICEMYVCIWASRYTMSEF